jgi:hypothetical protein
MNSPGGTEVDLLVRSRSALLDALQALEAHRDAVIVVGAQAVYLRTTRTLLALAEATKDSDLALDPRSLGVDPLIEEAMRAAHFLPDLESGQPGSWVNLEGIPVDLMVPEKLAGAASKNARSARIPPHGRRTMRRARGLEAAVVDNDVLEITSLSSADTRRIEAKVAGPAALIVAKIHKIAERAATSPHRLVDKDAHDLYRLLVDTDTQELALKFRTLLEEEVCYQVTTDARTLLAELFASGPDAIGSTMAGRAEQGVGEPEIVAQQVAILATDLLAAVDDQ